MKLGILADTAAVAVGEGSVMSILEILQLLPPSYIYRSSPFKAIPIGPEKPVTKSVICAIRFMQLSSKINVYLYFIINNFNCNYLALLF